MLIRSQTPSENEPVKPVFINKGILLKQYKRPQLIELGDLRSLTLGASKGDFVDSPPSIGKEWRPYP
jgi:hypothetical protein